MGMAGPTPAEWLNDCTKRAKFNKETGKIEADQDDWLNLIRSAQKAYGITDEELANLNDPVRA